MKSMSDRSFEIVTATKADAEAIWQVNRTSWLQAYVNPERHVTREAISAMFDENKNSSLARWAKRLESQESSHCQVCLAKAHGRVVGYCMVKINDVDEGWINSLYVLPDYHGCGVGAALMQSALDWLKARPVGLEVVSYNARAIAFYHKHGFQFASEEFFLEFSGLKLPVRKMVRGQVKNE